MTVQLHDPLGHPVNIDLDAESAVDFVMSHPGWSIFSPPDGNQVTDDGNEESHCGCQSVRTEAALASASL